MVIILGRSNPTGANDRADDGDELAEGGGALISIPGGGWSIADPDAAGGAERVELTYDEPPGPWTFQVHGQLVGGKPAITSVVIG